MKNSNLLCGFKGTNLFAYGRLIETLVEADILKNKIDNFSTISTQLSGMAIYP